MSKSLIGHLKHWFTPHIANNFRAKLLHSSGLLAIIGIVLVFNVLVRYADSTSSHILGFTSTITIDDVVRLTNEQRVSAGLAPLSYNETLADAARRKAANMIEENYWAHNSGSGKSPWYWFDQAGYKYLHAGENLAKDFGSADRMMNAWMNSPTHKENIVNAKYKDIGVAVVPGTLQGQDTVLVVQLFGSSAAGSVPVVSGASTNKKAVAKPVPTPVPTPGQVAIVTDAEIIATTPAPTPSPTAAPVVKYNTFNVKRVVAIGTTVLLMLALIFDLIVAESSSLSRRVGKNWAHLLFINVILILVTLIQAGSII